MTNWTAARLENLFKRYNQRYWRGRLPAYRCVFGRCGDENRRRGECDTKTRTITINPKLSRNDAEVRSTMLHEMAHAAAPKEAGHGVKFFAQVEKLLRMGARISVAQPEAGRVLMLADVVPKRFPLLRAKMLRAEARRVKKLDAFIANAKEPMPEHEETEDDILISFKDAALELPWKQALLSVGPYYNLTDETGRALNRRAARMIAKGKKQHMRARRDYYLQQKGREAWLTSQKERNNEPQNQERGRAETGA